MVKRNADPRRNPHADPQEVSGTAERPRLNVYRSVNHIYAQLIDDAQGRDHRRGISLAGQGREDTGGNVAAAKEVGKLIAERAKAEGRRAVVFDRGGYLYHGRIKALADAAREAGLNFSSQFLVVVLR